MGGQKGTVALVDHRRVRVEGIVRIFQADAGTERLKARRRLQARSNRNIRRTQQLMADLHLLVDRAKLPEERLPESDFPQIARFR